MSNITLLDGLKIGLKHKIRLSALGIDLSVHLYVYNTVTITVTIVYYLITRNLLPCIVEVKIAKKTATT